MIDSTTSNNSSLFPYYPWSSPPLNKSISKAFSLGMVDDPNHGALAAKFCLFSLSALQCFLLHPKFQFSASARWVRLCLGPVTIFWWMVYPFRHPIQPIETHIGSNLFQGVFSAAMVCKSLEWTFVSGPYFLRTPKFADGVPIWGKETLPAANPRKEGLGELIVWTLVQLVSQRGLRCSWGPVGKGNSRTLLQSVLELIRLHLINRVAVAFLLYCLVVDDASPANALISLGVVPFPGISIFARCLHSICFMFMASTAIELVATSTVIALHVVHPIANMLKFPNYMCDLLDPVNYPHHFNSIFNLSSVSHFWGQTWHQKFRRIFVFCGVKPATWLADFLGASANVRKIFGVFGAFTVSGLFHEYPLYTAQRPPSPNPRVPFQTFPGSFFFFFLQSFGHLLDPVIIPLIPQRVGGGRIWTIAFLLLTGPLFSKDFCQPEILHSLHRPISRWTWVDILIPSPLAHVFI